MQPRAMATVPGYDLPGLGAELRRQLAGGVHNDPLTLAMYTTDASNYRVRPDLVVVPRDTEDLVTACALAGAAGAPVAVRGAGTSMAGNCLGGVVIDVSRKLTRIRSLDPATRTAVVEPGVVLSDLIAAARPHRLTFGADPSSQTRCTLGGMIGNNACGAHSVAWGTTADNVLALEVLTAGGDRLSFDNRASATGALADRLRALGEQHRLLIERRFGTFSRQISGYALQHLLEPLDVPRLLCGSEGTLAVTTAATVSLTPIPPAVVLLALGFPDSVAAADCVPHVLPHRPLTMESINATLIDRLPDQVRRAAHEAGLPPGRVWLLVEVGDESTAAAGRRAELIGQTVRDCVAGATAGVVADPARQQVLWRCRRDSTGLATRRVDGAEAWGGWEDAAVPPERLGSYLRSLDELLARFGYSGASYGHFGEGCMHLRIDFDLMSDSGVRRYRQFVTEATDLVCSLGGSVSGEHGDGRARSELVERMYGAEATAVFDRLKSVWDPRRLLNPNVIVDPLPLDRDLRHRGQARTQQPATVFAYTQDQGSFTQAQRRCVGVAKCRQSSGGVMCPSFQATGEEIHSTRGRARLLWEMLEGELITDGWRSTEVAQALDLCLSCKGCLGDCPVNVDMATYKAEFTHQHFAGRPWARPRSHFSMGWLPLLARIAALAPRAANAASAAAPTLLKRLGGIAPQRQLPRFADQTFTTWFARRSPTGSGVRGRILLWPDTFTTHFSPEVAQDAVLVLEAAGFEVHLPERPVCCGLTWVSTGQLGTARRVLAASLRRIAPALQAGAPVVGLEPSCTAALRHDAGELLAGDPLAARLPDQVVTLAELLDRYAPDWEPPRVDRSALVQVHCHQHAVLGAAADSRLLARAGVAADLPDTGCCGLAGNFGFEDGHYQLSKAIGERALLPAVRAADPDTVVLADGFSCRTQIAQETERTARHLAQLLAAGLRGDRR